MDLMDASLVRPATLPVKKIRPKPRLRGWSHALAFALSPLAGVALLTLAPGPRALVPALVYAGSLSALFGVSALYHCPMWSSRPRAILRRLDHSTIFVFIAGTYTPMAMLLSPWHQKVMLAIAWGGAALGVLRAVFWTGAPRPIVVGLYLAVGWAALPFLPELWTALGPMKVAFIFTGGMLYTLGALVYGRRWPDPAPRIFGFHEIFHLLVIAAAGLHLAVIAGVLQEIR
jgi:hemolysin III